MTARINERESVQLMLDTGAVRTVINSSVLSTLGVTYDTAVRGSIKGVTGDAEVLVVRVETRDFWSADAGAGNFVPWTGVGPGRYHQIYSSSLFSGPISISQISFFNTQSDPGTADISEGNYSLRLCTTAAVPSLLQLAPSIGMSLETPLHRKS